MNTVQDLRAILFDQLKTLTSASEKPDLAIAKAVNETAQTIINSAKLEVEHAKTIKGAIMVDFLETNERPNGSSSPAVIENKPSAPALASQAAETQRALGFGGLPPGKNHPWRKDSDRDWQARQDAEKRHEEAR